MNMLTVLIQDGSEILGCTSFVAKEGGYVRGLTDLGWYDIAKYKNKDEAKMVVQRMFVVMQNGGKVFRMPRTDEV